MVAWVASAVARRIELWVDAVVLPPAVGAHADVLAFDHELLDLELHSSSVWFTPGGRNLAAAYLLPRAEAAARFAASPLA